MELFTLGRGRYTERDVQESARAFTGRFVVRDQFQEVASQHDGGAKTILGRTGNYNGDDVPGILLAQPACAGFVCGKLVRAFVTEIDPVTPALIEPLADAFRESGYNVRVPLAMILRSKLFFSTGVLRRRVKSPVEFAVGTVRALELVKPTVQADALADSCARMGQGLFAPPSVAGWDGGAAWANSTTMLTRTNLVLALLSPDDAALGNRFDPSALARRHGFTDAAGVTGFFSDLLTQDAFGGKVRDTVEAAARKSPAPAREAATLVLTAPEYQLA
jgi:uncharacterized protein (DUF1800 family)